MQNKIAVWHRDDLRVRDNPALANAESDGTAMPLFIADPDYYQNQIVSDARIRFVHESLTQLDSKYQALGGELTLLHGSPKSIIQRLLSENVIDKVYFNKTTNAGKQKQKTTSISQMEHVKSFDESGIVRDGDSRDNWQEQAENYFTSKLYTVPSTVSSLRTEGMTVSDIEAVYDIASTKERRHEGGCIRAESQLDAFIQNIGQYMGSISPPAEAEKHTSQLSPYFRFGCLSLRHSYQRVHEEVTDGRARELFTSRLFWNRHFTQKLQDNETLREHAVNPVFRGMNMSTHDEELALAWMDGNTGFPLIDASMRALKQTGWMNFRMRAMCASFYTYILRCWWKEGADWYFKHLIDADPAINYAQWQMQSGLVGVHPLRIYNPMKQVTDNDPDGEYIKKYVPELRDLPAQYLRAPEKTPLEVQDRVGISIGDDYPYPIVDFEKRRIEAREEWSKLSDRAKEALKDPEIRRRASLSRRRDKEVEETDDSSEGQTNLQDF